MRLLIAEDEEDLADALEAFFTRNQFLVDIVNDGQSAFEYGMSGNYDGIILDVMMPLMNGFEVLEKLRANKIQTPVMMLTARGEKDDRIHGFNSGADDYLPKPFDPDELIARTKAMLRRKGNYQANELTFGDLKLSCDSGLLSRGNEVIRLSGREYQLMELFMRSPNVLFSAERIMERIWGWDSESEINVVWVHISNIRKKLKEMGSTVNIKAVRGLGYTLEEAK